MSYTKQTDLPIGKDTEYLLKMWMEKSLVDSLPKVFRHALYPQVLKTIAQMVSDVYFANSIKEEKKEHLQRYIARLQMLKVYTRALHESRVKQTVDKDGKQKNWFGLSHKKASLFFDLYEKLLKQAVTWKNYTRNEK